MAPFLFMLQPIDPIFKAYFHAWLVGQLHYWTWRHGVYVDWTLAVTALHVELLAFNPDSVHNLLQMILV